MCVKYITILYFNFLFSPLSFLDESACVVCANFGGEVYKDTHTHLRTHASTHVHKQAGTHTHHNYMVCTIKIA